MSNDLQKAGIWKRTAAWMFDLLMIAVLAVGLGYLLSGLLGYDSYSQTLEAAYASYEGQYGVTFDISQADYQAMPESRRQNYDAAYEALLQDQEAMYAYNMMLSLSLVIASLGILAACLIWEFFIPMWLGDGQTLGKKIFGLCLVRNDCVKVNNLQLFTRMLLGKYTIEIMVPAAILWMLFWGTMGLTGTLLLLGLLAAQILCLTLTRTNSAIHDLLAGTVVVDMASQTIFPTTRELIQYQKQAAAEKAARQAY